MTDLPDTIKLVQLVGLTSAAWLSGSIATYSFASIPVLRTQPVPVAVLAWQRFYNIGSIASPPASILAALSFGYLACKASKIPGQSLGNIGPLSLYTFAAVIIPTIIPYTLIAMKDVNGTLHKKANSMMGKTVKGNASSAGIADDNSVVELFSKWQFLNGIRSIMVGAGALAATWATINIGRPELLAMAS